MLLQGRDDFGPADKCINRKHMSGRRAKPLSDSLTTAGSSTIAAYSVPIPPQQLRALTVWCARMGCRGEEVAKQRARLEGHERLSCAVGRETRKGDCV